MTGDLEKKALPNQSHHSWTPQMSTEPHVCPGNTSQDQVGQLWNASPQGSSLQSFPEHHQAISNTGSLQTESSELHFDQKYVENSKLIPNWIWQGSAQETPPVCV